MPEWARPAEGSAGRVVGEKSGGRKRRWDDAERHERNRRTAELLIRATDRSLSDAERQQCIDAAVQLNLSIAEFLARRYQARGEDLEDLIQVARLGLVQAVTRFDPDVGEFDAFAIPTIAGEIKRHFRDHFWTVPRPPRRVQELHHEVMAAWPELAQEYGRTPTTVEIATSLGVDREEVREAMAASPFASASLDATEENTHPATSRIGTTDPGFDDVDNALERSQLLGQLRAAITELSEEDCLILRMRFLEGCSQSVIAAELGTSQMSVSRRLTKITATLRQKLDSEQLSETAAQRRGSTVAATNATVDVYLLSQVCRVLADPIRCRLLLTISEGPVGPPLLAQQLGIPAIQLSAHVARLHDSGLISVTSAGGQLRYALADGAMSQAIRCLAAAVTKPEKSRHGTTTS